MAFGGGNSSRLKIFFLILMIVIVLGSSIHSSDRENLQISHRNLVLLFLCNLQTALVGSTNPRAGNLEILYFIANHAPDLLFDYIIVIIRTTEIEWLP